MTSPKTSAQEAIRSLAIFLLAARDVACKYGRFSSGEKRQLEIGLRSQAIRDAYPKFRAAPQLTERREQAIPALVSGYTFSRACHPLDDFPRLAPVISFPAPTTGCMPAFGYDWLLTLFYGLAIGSV